MVDVAVIFRFPPSEMHGRELSELIQWRERAQARSGGVQ